MKLAERMNRIGVETAFEVLVRARALEAQGRDIIHLEIGEPDFDTPAHIVEAAAEALRAGLTHYVPAPGLPEVREAVVAWLAGAGVKRGFSYGGTDEYGLHAVEGRMHTMDLHATLLALMGLDHERLTFRYAGRDFRLTDVAGNVATEIVA